MDAKSLFMERHGGVQGYRAFLLDGRSVAVGRLGKRLWSSTVRTLVVGS